MGFNMILMKTKRLVIREHEIEDIHVVHKLYSNPKVMYYLQDLRTSTIEETLLSLKAAIEEIHREKRIKYYFKIEDLESKEYIGEIGYTVRLDTPIGKIVNLGYFILPEFWGKGITTEAANEVVRFAFECDNVIKVESGCIKENKASERVMIKIGMTKEADYKMRVWHDNYLRDRVEYRLLKEEWKWLQGTPSLDVL